jgi:hypothetical protein
MFVRSGTANPAVQARTEAAKTQTSRIGAQELDARSGRAMPRPIQIALPVGSAPLAEGLSISNPAKQAASSRAFDLASEVDRLSSHDSRAGIFDQN